MKRDTLKAVAGGLCASAMVLGGTDASAGAFQLNERSTKALGTSLAGSTSAASDITFMSFNPAVLGTIDHIEAGGAAAIVSVDNEARVADGPAAGITDEPGGTRALPAFATGMRLTPELAVGFSTYSPFGLVTTYERGFPGGGDGLTSELLTISFSPAVAYEPIEGLTFGAAFNVLYVDARLTNSAINLDGDDVAYGFTLGALWEATPSTQIGVSYHHDYKDIDIGISHENALLGGLTARGEATASLPGSVNVGITQGITDDFRVMGEFRWINWSVFDEIQVRTPDFAFAPPLDNFAEEQNYEDAFFIAAGAEYDITRDMTLRGGIAWDETPTTDAFRTVRVPDSNRLWLSGGVSYAPLDFLTLDFSYSYLHPLEDPTVTIRTGPVAGSTIEYEGGAHIVSLGAAVRF